MFLCSCNARSHVSGSAVLMENNVTQPKWVEKNIYLLLLCSSKFYVWVGKSFYKKLPVRRFKRLETAALVYTVGLHVCVRFSAFKHSCMEIFIRVFIVLRSTPAVLNIFKPQYP